MIADVLWVFPGVREERLEATPVDDLLAWHDRARRRKRGEYEAIEAAMLKAVAALAGGRRS